MESTKKGTPLTELGEFNLIKVLTQDFEIKNPSTLKGIGDDAAVIRATSGKCQVVTTDLLTEGIHFNLMYTPLKHLGYKAAVVNFSDVYAMNAIPTQLTVTLAVSKRFTVEDLKELYAGLKLACDIYGVDLIGGDTSSSLTGLHISLTAIGEAFENRLVYRNGAKVNDLICVTGNLGASYLGLQLLERERRLYESSGVQPKLEGFDYILERQLKPEARKDVIQILEVADIIPTSMIDISDGLSSELHHICNQSGVGCRIYQGKIPVDPEAVKMAEELNLSIYTCALNGGEDYELLFTIPLSDYEKVAESSEIRVIGHITEASDGLNLVTDDAQFIQLQAQGWVSVNQ